MWALYLVAWATKGTFSIFLKKKEKETAGARCLRKRGGTCGEISKLRKVNNIITPVQPKRGLIGSRQGGRKKHVFLFNQWRINIEASKEASSDEKVAGFLLPSSNVF